MLVSDAVSHFKTKSEIARVCGLSKGAISQWGEVVPFMTALILAEKAGGALPVNRALYDERGRILKPADAA